MASLSYGDILKRDNVETLVERINKKGEMALGALKEGAPMVRLTGQVKLGGTLDKTLTAEELRMYLEAPGTTRVEVGTKEQKFVLLTKFFKSKEFGGVAAKAGGAGTERQEEGIIIHIRDAVKESGPVKIDGIPVLKIKDAARTKGCHQLGKSLTST